MDSDQGRSQMVPIVRVLKLENIYIFKLKLIYHCSIFHGKLMKLSCRYRCFGTEGAALHVCWKGKFTVEHPSISAFANGHYSSILSLLDDIVQLWQVALRNCSYYNNSF